MRSVWRRSLVEVAVGALLVSLVLVGSGPGLPSTRAGIRQPLLLGAAVVVVTVIKPGHGVLMGVVVGGAFGVLWLMRRRRRRQSARATSLAVVAVCRDLADDLRSGRVPGEALLDAARRWDLLKPVATAVELQHDVARALREASATSGAEGLRDLAAAWQVSSRSGSGLAQSLHDIAGLLASRERRARMVDAELAAARATGGVVSGLPLLVLGLGSGLGTNPWAFFLGGVGQLVMALAALLMFCGWAWLDLLTSRDGAR